MGRGIWCLTSWKESYERNLVFDVIHLEKDTAKAIGVYKKDYYKGYPVVTVNKYGNGYAYYVGTFALQEFLKDLVFKDVPYGIEITQRVKEGKVFTFVLNHSEEAKKKYYNIGRIKQGGEISPPIA